MTHSSKTRRRPVMSHAHGSMVDALAVAGATGLGVALMASGARTAGAATTADAIATPTGAAVIGAATQVTDAQAVHGLVTAQRDQVRGTFAFTQTEVATNDYLARHLAEGSTYLCGASPAADGAAIDPTQWTIAVQGAVNDGYSATVEEIASTDAAQQVLMGCACAGNPAGGRSAANAVVNGISALAMIQLAKPAADANTITFTSSDGYQVSIPLTYLETHYCPIVFDVNGSPLADSMGGANQLWLGSTPASYFVRNVTSITVEARDEADIPASPTSEEARAQYGANLPNVGILLGGEVRS